MVAQERESRMDSKRLGKRLDKIGYRLDRDVFGWIVVSLRGGSDFRFSTLGGVNRFVVDNEATVRHMNQYQTA
jgi:hypothetical protein